MSDGQFQSPEIALYWRYLTRSLDHFVELAGSIPHEALHWKPPAAESNSIAVLAVHTLGNVEENVLEILNGNPVNRQRDAEFVEGTIEAAALNERWQALRARLEPVLLATPAAELDRERTHARRGTLTGREVLLVATRHAAEHMGQAELTRDLWNATRQTS